MKQVIITGSSRGIGLATAKLLLQNEEVKVIGTSTSGESSINHPNFKCFQLDLSSKNSIIDFIGKLNHKKIDFIINNAAILLENNSTSTINISQLRKTFEVNVFGTIELTEALLSQTNSGGHIINITSSWGAFSETDFTQYQPHYKMSKATLNMYTKLLAKRLESNAIKVSSLDPGWTQTDMGGFDANRKPNDAAMDIISLLTDNVDSGFFWHRGKIRNW